MQLHLSSAVPIIARCVVHCHCLSVATLASLIMAEPMFKVDTRAVVIETQTQETIMLRNQMIIDGQIYWRVAKGDPIVARILVGKSHTKERQLTKSDIIDSLIKLRNAAIEAIVTPVDEQSGKEDLGLDDPASNRPTKRSKISLPPVVEITTPKVGPLDPMQIKALTMEAGMKTALWIEFTTPAVNWIIAAVRYQLQNVEAALSIIKAKAVPKTTSIVAVNWEQSRNSWRARRADGKQKYFRLTKFEDAQELAVKWSKGLISDDLAAPIGDEEQKDDGDQQKDDGDENRSSAGGSLG